MPEATFDYPQGAHFRGPLSNVGGLVAGFLFLNLFFIPVKEALEWQNIIGYIFGVPLFIVSISMFMAQEGIEVDQNARMIRKYSKFLWIRYGEWVPVSNFERILLKHYRSGHAGHSYHMYSVILQGRDYTIMIDEYKTHTHARDRMTFFANEFGLPWHDELVERLHKSKANRRR